MPGVFRDNGESGFRGLLSSIPLYVVLASLWVFASHLVFDILIISDPRHEVYELLADAIVAFPTTLLVFLLLRPEVLKRTRVEAARRESESRLAHILGSAAEAIIGIDPDGSIFLFNRDAEGVFGCSEMEASGKPIDRFIPEGLGGLRDAASPSATSFLQARSPKGEPSLTTARRMDGSTFPVEVTRSLLTENNRTFITLFLHDITRHKEAEDALRQSHQDLEERVRERTEELRSAYGDLETRTRELAALLSLSQKVAATLELQPLWEVILDQLKAMFDCDRAAILVPEGDSMTVTARRGPLPEEVVPELADVWRETLSFRPALKSGRAVIIDDICRDENVSRVLEQTLPVSSEAPFPICRSWMGVPMLIKDRPVGLLRLARMEPGCFTERHTQLAVAIAGHVAIALENARLYRTAQRLAVMEERQRLARELHDSVSQALYGIALGAHTASELLDLDPTRVKDSLDYILRLADAAVAEMRFLIFELRPDYLESEGLNSALTRLTDALRKRHKFDLQLDLCPEPDLRLDLKEALYRICHEGLWNTSKHARARTVNVRLCKKEDWVAVDVEDDGVGFDVIGTFPGHMGIQSMRERAASLGGNLEIISRPSQGTWVRTRIPLATAEKASHELH